jgi:hypothetical protein
VDPDSDPQHCKQHHDETYTVTAEMKMNEKWRKWTRQNKKNIRGKRENRKERKGSKRWRMKKKSKEERWKI